MSDLDIVRGDINNLRETMQELIGEVKVLSSKAHTPLDCPLANDVKRLQLHEARQAGALAVIGVVATLIASAIATALARIWGK